MDDSAGISASVSEAVEVARAAGLMYVRDTEPARMNLCSGSANVAAELPGLRVVHEDHDHDEGNPEDDDPDDVLLNPAEPEGVELISGTRTWQHKLDAEQLVWDQAARPEPEGVEILAWLGARGIKRAICSNAPFPAEMMLRQVRTNGLAGMVDAVIFSSQIGRRKPAPEAYRAALEAVGAGADSALFVGDRFREDYEGPRSLGMRAVICTAHAAEPPPHGTATIVSLRELRGLL